MGTNRTPTHVRGFITPYELTTNHIWQQETTATQGTARAGIPTEVTKSGLVLGARGLQTEAVDVKTLEGGHVNQNAKFGWKYATDTSYYGHNMPNVVTDVTAVATLNLAGQKFIVRDAVTLNDGTVLVAIEYTTATNNNVRVYAIDRDGNTSFTTVNGVAVSTLGGELRHPCLCVLDNGNVLCLFYSIDTAASLVNIQVYQTTDNGGSWDLISNRALINDISLTGIDSLNKITAAASRTQVCLFIETATNTGTNKNKAYQYASISQGAKFDLVGSTPVTSTVYRLHEIDIVQHNGVFILSFIRNNDQMGVTQITDAYDNIFNALVFSNITTIDGDFLATLGGVGNDVLTNGDKSMHIDTDGRIYIYARLLINNLVGVAYSDTAGQSAIDYGRTWHFIKAPTATDNLRYSKVIDCGDVGDVANITTTSYDGQQLMFNNWLPNGTNAYQHSIIMMRLGMWATQNYPRYVKYATDSDYTSSTLDWLPADLPTEGGQWIKTTTGTPSETLTGARLYIRCPGGTALQYRTAITDKSKSVLLHAKLDGVVGGGASQGTYIGVQIQTRTSSTQGYHVRVYITPTSLYLYDALNSTQLDSVTGLPEGERALFLYVDNNSGRANLYYVTKQGPRQYALLTGSAIAGAQTANQYIWGATSTTIGTDANWAYFSVSENGEMGIGVDGEINGKQYPALGYYAALDAGLYITTQDGPARQSDLWDIQPQYDYPIDRVLYSVSPTRGNEWRSDTVADPDADTVPQNNIAWALDVDAPTAIAYPRNKTLGLHLSGVNFRRFFLDMYNGSTWVQHCTVANQVGPDWDFTRSGNTVVCAQNVDGPFLHYGECVDWYLYLYDDNDELTVRKIIQNTEGVIDNSSTTKTVTFTILEPTGAPSFGYAQLVPNVCTVVLNSVSALSALRIRIGTQKTNEGYFKIGHMVFGPVVLPATQYGRGRTINFEANTDINEAQNGVLHTRVNGRGGRTVRIAWTDGIDVTELHNTNPDPDYYTTKTGGQPVAAVASAPTTMYGIVQQMQGAHDALVYLPTVYTATGTNCLLINRYHDHVMVTLGNDIQIENVIGDESKNEVLRVGTVVMREVR